jgi:hypothetical protein
MDSPARSPIWNQWLREAGQEFLIQPEGMSASIQPARVQVHTEAVLGAFHVWVTAPAPHRAMPLALRCSTRSARAAAACEWVTSTSEAPWLAGLCHQGIHHQRGGLRVEVAGGFVGQQQAGRCTRARAMATRCNWPPLSCCGSRRPGPAGPRIPAFPAPACGIGWWPSSISGRPRFAPRPGAAAHGRPGTQSHMPAAHRARAGVVQRAQVGAVRAHARHPSVSRPAMQLSRVDLPTPDSPTMATNSPRATVRSTLVEHGHLAIAIWPARQLAASWCHPSRPQGQHLLHSASGASQAPHGAAACCAAR